MQSSIVIFILYTAGVFSLYPTNAQDLFDEVQQYEPMLVVRRYKENSTVVCWKKDDKTNCVDTHPDRNDGHANFTFETSYRCKNPKIYKEGHFDEFVCYFVAEIETYHCRPGCAGKFWFSFYVLEHWSLWIWCSGKVVKGLVRKRTLESGNCMLVTQCCTLLDASVESLSISYGIWI